MTGKVRGRPFQKGQSGNLAGRSKKDKAIDAAKKMNYSEFLDEIRGLGGLTKEQLNEIAKDPKTPMNKLIVVRLIIDVASGKPEARRTYLDRLFGKVKDQVEHSGNLTGNNAQIVVNLPANGYEAPINQEEN
jgi:hypothetical protein